MRTCVCVGHERGRAEDRQAEAERSGGHQRPTGHDDSNELVFTKSDEASDVESRECLQSTSNLRKRQI